MLSSVVAFPRIGGHAGLQGFAPPIPALNFSGYEPSRPWCMFYSHVTVEVYTLFGAANPKTWKWCILFADLNNSRPWKCIPFADLNTQGLGIVYYFWTWKLNASGMNTIFGSENSRPWKRIPCSDLINQGSASDHSSDMYYDHSTCMYYDHSVCM